MGNSSLFRPQEVGQVAHFLCRCFILFLPKLRRMTKRIEATKPYDGQAPGTSGLRKKVTVFQQENYLANFVQSIFDALPKTDYEGQTMLVGGDGRFWNTEAIHEIVRIAAGNGVQRLWVGQYGWLSTPAGSAIIREREGGICRGGIILTASHNPGGPTEDFGIKYNCSNGGPAPEQLSDLIFAKTKTISKILVDDSIPKCGLDLTKLGTQNLTSKFVLEIIDPFDDWVSLMRSIFDFERLKSFISNPKFNFVYDGLNGIAGPYAKRLFLKELGAPGSCLIQCESMTDFGGTHPDPNLTYAKVLVDRMGLKSDGSLLPERTKVPDFGAAGDGDNDRNMILGREWFVTPSDSVAIIAAFAGDAIPYFKKNKISGVARSMPTSCSLKAVAETMGVPHYETPTGWKYFVNLMDAGKVSICGEESFGTGSNHIREKDGLWAVLAWLSILAHVNNDHESLNMSVQQINEEFWEKYGRNYYMRYDYEDLDTVAGQKVYEEAYEFRNKMTDGVVAVEHFDYTDPVDKSLTLKQGIQFRFADPGKRIIFRKSGTGSSGVTIRIYMEYATKNDFKMDRKQALKDLVDLALKACQIENISGRKSPTVIT